MSSQRGACCPGIIHSSQKCQALCSPSDHVHVNLTALGVCCCWHATQAVMLVIGLVLSTRFMMPAMTLLGPIS